VEHLNLFFAGSITPADQQFILDEENSRHCIQVLRMPTGDKLLLTDGKGHRYEAIISVADKRHCVVQVQNFTHVQKQIPQINIGISYIRQSSRMEWFLEKVTEIGVDHIYPLICERTAKEHYKPSRLQQIIISAMLQSQQYYLPCLHEPLSFSSFLEQNLAGQKFIAHCMEGGKKALQNVIQTNAEALVLVGPEGDFTRQEVDMALHQNFIPVSLGDNRLRSETAGVVACTLLRAGMAT
jgi:16S rRNA (uracil1498-N3)-methyltransferase